MTNSPQRRLWFRRLTAGLTVMALVMIGGHQIADMTASWRAAEAATVAHTLGQSLEHLSKAAQNLAFERGRSNVVLRGADPISADNRLFLNQRRSEGSARLRQAMTTLAPHLPDSARRLGARLEMLEVLRAQVDAAAQRPRAQRPSALPVSWMAAATATLTELQEAAAAITRVIGPHHSALSRLGETVLLSLQFRDIAGLESTTLATALAAGEGATPDLLQRLARLRGQGEAVWQSLERNVDGMTQPEPKAAIAAVQATFFAGLRPLQDKALQAWLAGTVPALGVRDYAQASVAGLDAIVAVTTAAVHSAQHQAALLHAEARWQLGWSVASLLIVVTATVMLGWLWRHPSVASALPTATDEALPSAHPEAAATACRSQETAITLGGLGVVRLDAAGRIIEISPIAATQLNQPPALLAGRRLIDVLPGVDLSAGGIAAWQGEVVTADGAWLAAHLGHVPGQPDETLVVLQDVSRAARCRVSLEFTMQRLERILAHAGLGIFALDGEGYVTFANAAALDLLRCRPDALIGKDLHAEAHHSRANGSPYPGDDCPVWRTLGDGRTRRIDSDTFWRADASAVSVSYVVSALRGDDGEAIAGAVIIITRPAAIEAAGAKKEARAP